MKTKIGIFIFASVIAFYCFAKNEKEFVVLAGNDCKNAIYQRNHSFLKSKSIEIDKLADSICIKIEAILPRYFDSLKVAKINDNGIGYYRRQYIGFKIGSENYVYINLIAKHNEFKNWEKKPIWVMDGGDSFCGIIFDIKNNRFIEINCNGNA